MGWGDAHEPLPIDLIDIDGTIRHLEETRLPDLAAVLNRDWLAGRGRIRTTASQNWGSSRLSARGGRISNMRISTKVTCRPALPNNVSGDDRPPAGFDFEMRRFESCRPSQPVRLQRITYKGRSKTARYHERHRKERDPPALNQSQCDCTRRRFSKAPSCWPRLRAAQRSPPPASIICIDTSSFCLNRKT